MKIVIFLVIFLTSVFAENKNVTLNEAIQIALEKNKQNEISKLALEIAKVQYEQALSANYPAINAMVVGQRKKDDVIFQQRGEFTLPSSFSKTLALANALQISDSAIREATLAGITATPESAFPEGSISADIDAKAMGRDTVKASLNILYPLFTGGKISSLIEQAKLNKLLATNKITRANQDVIFDIKKYFYGYVLTNELYNLSNSTLKTMKFVSSLTKQFYENGNSLNVKKTDYLSVQVTESLIESIVAKLELNRAMVKSALANAMGLPWDSEINPIYKDSQLLPPNYILADLVKEAYRANTDITQMDIALKISEQQIKEQQAGHYPTVALMGEVSHTYNSYEYGFLNEDHANSWNVGFAVDMPIFDGFRTTNAVKEKKLDKKKMYLLQDMLKDGLALQIKNELTKASIGFKQIQTLKNTKKLAKENKELNIKGYEIDAIETEKVIQAQYIETYVKADYLKYVHDYLISLATIDKLIGTGLK
jgi:outer membrane protein